jgi:hypothetical protein
VRREERIGPRDISVKKVIQLRHALSEGDDGDLFPAARSDAKSPGAQILRLGLAAAEVLDVVLVRE